MGNWEVLWNVLCVVFLQNFTNTFREIKNLSESFVNIILLSEVEVVVSVWRDVYPAWRGRVGAQRPSPCRFLPYRRLSVPQRSPQMCRDLWPCRCAGAWAGTGRSLASSHSFLKTHTSVRNVQRNVYLFFNVYLLSVSQLKRDVDVSVMWALTFSFGLSEHVHDLSVGGVLAQGSDDVSALGEGDLHLVVWRSVKKLERIFEI